MIELNKTYNENGLDTMARMADCIIDLTVTSPPYDILRTYTGEIEWTEDVWKTVLKDLYRVTKQGGVVVWIVGDATIKGSETGTSFKHALWAKECGFNLHDTMIWEKPTFTATGALKVRYAQVFEYMFVFSKGRVNIFNPIKDRPTKGSYRKLGTIRQRDGSTKPQSSRGKVYTNTHAQRFNVWKMHTEASSNTRLHPAQFPEQLANDRIISWSNKGDLVYDPFMGSGTTAKMAVLNGRKYIGSEVSKEYCDVIAERLAKLQMLLPLTDDRGDEL